MNTDDEGNSARLYPIPPLSDHGRGGNAIKNYMLFLGVFALILTGCREETDIYFYTNQTWKLESALTVDKALVDLFMGVGGMAIGSELGVSIPSNLLQSDNWINLSYDWIVNQYRAQGLDARWRQSSNTYIIIVKGADYGQVPGVSTGMIILEPVAGTDDQYHLQMQALNIADMGELGEMNDQLSMLGFGYERAVTLHAGKIILSNADEVRGGMAIWRNPGLVDVTFEPARPFSTPILFTFLCMGSVIGTITLAVKAKGFGGVQCPNCGKRARKGQEICPDCGGYLGSGVFDV